MARKAIRKPTDKATKPVGVMTLPERAKDGRVLVVNNPIDGLWRVRIELADGMTVESKQAFATADEAKQAGDAWCADHGIQTEIVG